MWVGTFHRFCSRLLRWHADLVGLTVEAAQSAWAAAGFTPQNLSFTNYRCHNETFGEGLVWWHTGVVGSLQPLQFAHVTGYVNTCE